MASREFLGWWAGWREKFYEVAKTDFVAVRSNWSHPDIETDIGPLCYKLDKKVLAGLLFVKLENFVEQLWHDLAVQGHIELCYRFDSISGDSLWVEPNYGFDETAMHFVSPNYDCENWIHKDVYFDLLNARDGAAANGFEEMEIASQDGGVEPNINGTLLAYAAAYGDRSRELRLSNDRVLDGYLEKGFEGDDWYLEANLTVIADPAWNGPRYRDLNGEAQLALAKNVASLLKHPFYGPKTGIAGHLLACLVLHDESDGVVRQFLGSLGNPEIDEAIFARKPVSA